MEEKKSEGVVEEKPALLGMIMNPSVQFERIRENPKILLAIVGVTFISFIGSLMMATGMGDMLDTIPELESLTEEEIIITTMFMQIGAVIAGVISPVIMVLISSVIFLVVAKVVRADVTFKQLFSMNTYIFLISALSLLLNGLLFMVIKGGNPEIYYTSLNSVIGADGVLGAVFNSIEVFSIWSLVLTALGLQIVGKFSKGMSWAIVIVFFIVTLVFSMVTAAAGAIGV